MAATEEEKQILKKTIENSATMKGVEKILRDRLPTKEDRREEGRNAGGGDGGGKPSSDDKGGPTKAGGFLGMVKALGGGLGKVASTFLSVGGFLLKKAFFPITAITSMLTSTVALVGGLVAIAALFAGVGVASFMLTDKEFDELKNKIAEGVAGVFSKIVTGAVDIYNSFVPDSMKVSEDDKKKMGTATFTAVKDTIIGIIDFTKDIVDAFGEGFSKNMEGIKEKASAFTSKIGDVYDKIKGWMTSIGEKTDTKGTLLYVVNLLGDGLGKVISGILSIGNFLADLIIDPTVTLATLQVSIEDAFQSMGRNIADFLDGMFNKESMLKMMQGMFGKDSLMMAGIEEMFGTVEEAAADRQKEIRADSDRMKQKNAILQASAKETDRQLKEELALGEKRDNEKVRNLTLMLAREKKDIERNEAGIERANESIKASKEIIIQEKVDAAMGEEARKQERANEKLKKEIRGIEGRQKNIATGMGYSADVSGINETITGKAWESMLAAVQKTMGSDVTAEQLAGGQVKLSAKAVNEILRTNSNFARDNLSNMEDQAIMFKTGLALQKESAANQLKIDERKAKLAGTEVALAKKRKDIEKTVRLDMTEVATGGYVTKTGLAKIHQGELMMDNDAAEVMANAALVLSTYLPVSGQTLNQLQRDRISQNGDGKSGDANFADNSQNQQTTNVTHITSVAHKGVPGQGTDMLKIGSN